MCLGVSLRRFQQWFQQYNEAGKEIVIPKKKQAKRKLRTNEAASPKRIKPNPKPELRVLKKLVSRAISSNQAPKSGFGYQ